MMIKAALHGSLSGFIALFPRSSLSIRTATYSCGGCALLNCRLRHSRFNLYEWCPLELCTKLISTAIAMNLLTADSEVGVIILILKIRKLGLTGIFFKKSKIQSKRFYKKFRACFSQSVCFVSCQEITLERSKQSISNGLPYCIFFSTPTLRNGKSNN